MPDASKKRLFWIRIGVLAIISAVAYFANVEIQSYLGEKTRGAIGLELRSLEDATAIAVAEGKPILVELSAVWCPACRKFDKAVLSDPSVQAQINAGFVFAHLEYESDEGEAFMQLHNVKGFPTTYILNTDGTLIRQLRTTMNPVKFSEQLSL
jgi:thiol:disulfide interchange protein|tara:strand:+ start:4004 stop:4462 length:459 start_codon:yes stop_codon:yes gene_type:complete